MTKLINSLDLSKYMYAFFDVDGVLSIPCYVVNGQSVVGMPEDDWLEFNTFNKNTYSNCRHSEILKEFIAKAISEGVDCKILTAEPYNKSLESKVTFILDKYGDYFHQDDFYTVATTMDKLHFLERFCEVIGCPRDSVLIVDDNFDLCVKAQCSGFKSIHNSYFME